MNRKTRFAIASTTLGATLVLAPVAGIAYATSPIHPKPGGECRDLGATVTITTHDGPYEYRCEQRDGETCGHYRIIPGQNPPKRGWPRRTVLPCQGWCTPTPSTSASPAPSTPPSRSASAAASPSGNTHTTPAAGTLPITGVPWGPVAFLGAVLVGLGVTIRAVARRL